MKIDASSSDFARWIGDFLRFDVKESEGAFVFTSKSGNFLKMETLELENVIAQLRAKEELDHTAIYDDHIYEVIVKHTSNFPFQNRGLSKKDPVNGITYTLSRPSSEYLLFLLHRVSAIVPLEYLSSPNPRRRRGTDKTQSILKILGKASSHFLSLRVESEQSRPVNTLVAYATAFLFDLGYNLDAAFIAPKHFDDLVRRGRLRQQRRKVQPKDVLAPRRFYELNLTYYYQLALATEAPSLQYLSYYHILEYFGEGIFMDDMIERVRNIITQPAFSYRRDIDIKQLIKAVEELPKTKPNSTDDAKRDERALRMTLERYVDISSLLEKLRNYDADLVKYYRDNTVPFDSKACRVDLEQKDASLTLAHLARRIYRTRNAIVHSKEAEASRYTPFTHDGHLSREIPLLRFIAELIILESSKIIPN